MKKANKNLTVKKLEENTIGQTNCGDYIAEIKGTRYYYNYRRDDGIFSPVCDKKDASHIQVTTYDEDTEFICKRINL